MVATPKADRGALEQRAQNAADIFQQLHELADMPGWRILQETFERQRAGYYERLARDLMQGKEIDQRKLDYNRGFFESVEQLLESPGNAEKILERAVKRLQRLAEDEQRSDSE